MKPKQKLEIILDYDSLQRWLYAVTWIFFLLFFAYTSLFFTLVKESETFLAAFKDEYFKLEASYSYIFINFGLLAMLVFDYLFLNKSTKQMKRLTICIMISFFLIIGIYFHAINFCSENAYGLLKFLADSKFAIILNFIYLCILFWIKLESLTDETKLIIITKF